VKRKTLAIPIRVTNWSDTSQVVMLFTRSYGIVEAVAKGAHRFPNPFQGPFDLGILWDVIFAERPPERGLSILTEGAVADGFRGTRRSWLRIASAAYVLEFLRAVGTSGEAAETLFDAAVETMAGIGGDGCPPGIGPPRGGSAGPSGEDARAAAWLLSFECRALRALGLTAPPAVCSDCGRPWSGSDRPVVYSAKVGGLLCGTCRKDRPGVLVGGRAVRALEALASPPGASPEDFGLDLLPDLIRLVGEIRVFLLEHQFRMLQYVPL